MQYSQKQLSMARKAFDEEFYVSRYKDMGVAVQQGVDPFEHFMAFGWKEGRNPNKNFLTKDYTDQFPEIKADGINPFVHFLENESNRAESDVDDEDRELVARYFDENYYREQCDGMDIDVAGIEDFVHHFLTKGSALGLDPTNTFSTNFYRHRNPDVIKSGMNVYVHYLRYGHAEGRAAFPDENELSTMSTVNLDLPLNDIRLLKKHFDKDFYLRNYEDLRKKSSENFDPFEHYMTQGWREGRKPNIDFDTKYYLQSNPDVAAAAIHPFLHYLKNGKKEGRRPTHGGGFRYDILANQPKWDDYTKKWDRPKPKRLLSNGELRRRTNTFFASTPLNVVLCFSHDNYTNEIGGVQLCLQIEENHITEMDGLYINLHPANPLPKLSTTKEPQHFHYVLMVNGLMVGVANAAEIGEWLSSLPAKKAQKTAIIHQLLGQSPEIVSTLIAAFKPKRQLFWVHDYFSVCPGYTLMRNEISFCGAPPSSSPACGICFFGEERLSHEQRMQKFFHVNSFEVVAPAKYTLELWKSRTDLKHGKTHVNPLCVITKSEKKRPKRPSDRPVRVAFLGHRTSLKGWEIFDSLVTRLHKDKRYEFYLFSSEDTQSSFLKHIRVQVSETSKDAMQSALEEHELDVVILWSLCPETFSFTLHEALAAGTAVITGQDSGNIQATLKELNTGYVLNSEKQLFDFFCDDCSYQAMASDLSKPKDTYHLKHRAISAELLK